VGEVGRKKCGTALQVPPPDTLHTDERIQLFPRPAFCPLPPPPTSPLSPAIIRHPPVPFSLSFLTLYYAIKHRGALRARIHESRMQLDARLKKPVMVYHKQ